MTTNWRCTAIEVMINGYLHRHAIQRSSDPLKRARAHHAWLQELSEKHGVEIYSRVKEHEINTDGE